MGPADRERQVDGRGQESELPRHLGQLLAQPDPCRRGRDHAGSRHAVLRQRRALAGDPRRARITGMRIRRGRRLRRRCTMTPANIETYFNEVATLLDRSVAPGEIYTCRLDAEVSDFVRLNRGKVRQPGTVAQCYLRLHLIVGGRHAEQCLTVAADLGQDGTAIAAALTILRATVAALPEDPHLSFATDIRPSRVVRSSPLPAAEEMVETVLAAADGLD